jgi:hypothetical protein
MNELDLNRRAVFETGATPAVVVGGAAVHAYWARGTLRVSVHLDTGDIPEGLLNSDGTVPIHVAVNGETVFEAS